MQRATNEPKSGLLPLSARSNRPRHSNRQPLAPAAAVLKLEALFGCESGNDDVEATGETRAVAEVGASSEGDAVVDSRTAAGARAVIY